MSKRPKKPKTPKKAGRPSKYSPTLGRAICRLVERDGYIGIAAESMGISRMTVYSWVRRGESGDPEFADFAAEAAQAKAIYVQRNLRSLPRANVNATIWKLEKVDPELFGKKTPDTQVTLNQSLTLLPREQALAELRELAKTDPEVAQLLAGRDD